MYLAYRREFIIAINMILKKKRKEFLLFYYKGLELNKKERIRSFVSPPPPSF